MNTASSRLARLMDGPRIAMLTTCQPDGELDARPMSLLDVDDGGCLWFFAEHAPDDAAAQTRYARVNLCFSDCASATYASVSGHGELLHQTDRIAALWTEDARPWFPEGPESPRLAVLKVTPQRSEFWDAPDSRIARGATLTAPALNA